MSKIRAKCNGKYKKTHKALWALPLPLCRPSSRARAALTKSKLAERSRRCGAARDAALQPCRGFERGGGMKL